MKTIVHIIVSARPHQWVKNVFIFIPLIFAQKIFDYHSLTLSVQAFFAFSLMSSAVYLFNDVSDMEADRQHPENRIVPTADAAPKNALILVVPNHGDVYFKSDR